MRFSTSASARAISSMEKHPSFARSVHTTNIFFSQRSADLVVISESENMTYYLIGCGRENVQLCTCYIRRKKSNEQASSVSITISAKRAWRIECICGELELDFVQTPAECPHFFALNLKPLDETFHTLNFLQLFFFLLLEPFRFFLFDRRITRWPESSSKLNLYNVGFD